VGSLAPGAGGQAVVTPGRKNDVMQLTEAQAARLWCFDAALCERVLDALVESRFLERRRNSSFARAV
jgi:hypothetical protein